MLQKDLVTVDVVSAAGASLPKEVTVSFTDGVDVWRMKEEAELRLNSDYVLLRLSRQSAAQVNSGPSLVPPPSPTFLSCPSGESDKKLALTSSRSEPLELTEVTLRASPLSPPPPWYGLKCDWSKDLE